MSKKSCLIIAGEKSGEDHTMTFFPALKAMHPDCDFFGVGGTELEKEGVEILYHLKDFSSIGISSVIGKIPFYFRAMDHLLDEVKKRNCKVAILVDFQGFNLKISKKLKSMGVEVLYYVAPQAWVWKPWRAKTLQENVHTLFTIIPFEKKWFGDRGVKSIKGVMHPLMVKNQERLNAGIRHKTFAEMQGRKKRLLLLPGSRNMEVETLFPIFLRAIELIREKDIELELSLVKVESVSDELYQKFEKYVDKVYLSNELENALEYADICFAASGTVTLATGLFELPTVVAYKLSLVNEFLMRLLIPYDGPASLTNIVHEEYVFPEFIQYEADRYNLSKWAIKWLSEEQTYDDLIKKLKNTKNLLSGDDFSVPDYMGEVIKSAYA
jgi:lipid-A-disaccharide synthase